MAGKEPSGMVADVQDRLPAEIRDPSFPHAVRGYDRHAVDAYVEKVNRLIAELQVGGSPRAAVRHALDRVGEQTAGILQRARETAEEITSSARQEAEETTSRAGAEAADIIAGAEREAGASLARARAEADELSESAKAQANDLLVHARDEAESTVARARIDAEGRVRRSQEEATQIEEQARERIHALQADIAAIVDERHAVLDEVRSIAGQLADVVAKAESADEEIAEWALEPGDTEAPPGSGDDAEPRDPPAHTPRPAP